MTGDPERSPGDVLDGRYRLVHRLGRGGFGDVWRAEELLPDGAPFRDVALKLLLGDHGPFVNCVDWAEEAKLLASFRHPSLVTVYAAGILDTSPPQRFVAMELLLGQSLGDLTRARGPVPWRRVLRWACHTAAALDVIHLRGVIHLDLKPVNLFLCADGALKVLDFGISRRAEGAMARRAVTSGRPELSLAAAATVPRLVEPLEPLENEAFAATRPVPSGTASGRAVIGTPGFMAPEVLENGEPTAATDAFALAVCIAELATGKLPHAAADEPATWDDPTVVSLWLVDLRRATLRGDLRDLEAGPMGLPRGLAALVRRLLAVDPRARGVVPGQLAAMLEDVWARPFGVQAPPYPGLSPLPPEAEGLLFGRDEDIARLGRELSFEPCVVLQGVHGVGKTSLALVGLVPFLARGAVDGKDDWIAVPVRPGADPDTALDRALQAVAPELEGAGASMLTRWCQASPVGLALIVDPLGDVAAAAEGKRSWFARLLAAIASGGTLPGLRLIGAVAEENVDALLAVPDLGPALRPALRFVGAPAASAVVEIVGGPAHFAGVEVVGMEEIAAEVQRELRAGDARLPFVALALRAFWSTREPKAPLRRDGAIPSSSAGPPLLRSERWRELGGVPGALARHADRVLASLDSGRRVLAEELLVRLSATDGTKLSWPAFELLGTLGGGPHAKEAEEVLAVLSLEHLVLQKAGQVEIAHEALLTAWPRLSSLRLHQMDRLLFLEQLREAALAWERADEHADFLARGALLRDLLASDKAGLRASWTRRGLSARELEFVRRSRRRARGQRVLRVALGIGLALVAAAGVMLDRTLDEARAAKEAEAKAADHQAYVADMVERSRRTSDPFQRSAYIAEAVVQGSTDGMLPLELGAAVGNSPYAEFLTLDHVTGPSFPWGERWLVGAGPGEALTLVDFQPNEPQVFEDLALDADPEAAALTHFKKPRPMVLVPHADPVVERLPFAFDTSLVTRSVTGEVKVFRLRPSGDVALAAVAPMRCTGAVRVAEAAPVVACPTDEGIARWDLRTSRGGAPGSVDTHAFPGSVAAVSADGSLVAATIGRRVLLWAPEERREATFTAQAAVVLARFGPRDRVLAAVEPTATEIVDVDRPGKALITLETEAAPAGARWDDGGFDLAVCDQSGGGRWHYLKHGGRAKEDRPPTAAPCGKMPVFGNIGRLVAPPSPDGPRPLRGASDYDELAEKELGPHPMVGGFRLSKKRVLSHDLVLFDASDAAAARLLKFEGKDELGAEQDRSPKDSVVAVVRQNDGAVAFQVGDTVHVYSVPDGARIIGHKGNLLGRCDDDRLLVWESAGAFYRLDDVWTAGEVARVPREPGYILGTDSACATLYTQRLDGTLVAWPLGGEGTPAPRPIALGDGYVFAVHRSPAREPFPAGLLLALSSGAIARIDEGTAAVRLLGYATPRATALGDGPKAGQVVYADATGVQMVDASGATERVLQATVGTTWEDLSVSRDGQSMLLASADRVAVVDLARRELLGFMPAEGQGRLSPWDDEGSVLLWSFDRVGGPEGQVIPRGPSLMRQVAIAASNLTVQGGKLALERR